MKRFALTTLLVASALAAGSAQAATASNSFDVNIALTPVCKMSTIGNMAMSYTAFTTTDVTGSTNFSVQCSTDLSFSLGLDAASLTDGATGLDYTLALKTANTGDASTAIGTLASQKGVAAGTTYYVQGFIAKNQGGTTTAGTANNTRTVTVTY
jgi:spore coat protein U-like protein